MRWFCYWSVSLISNNSSSKLKFEICQFLRVGNFSTQHAYLFRTTRLSIWWNCPPNMVIRDQTLFKITRVIVILESFDRILKTYKGKIPTPAQHDRMLKSALVLYIHLSSDVKRKLDKKSFSCFQIKSLRKLHRWIFRQICFRKSDFKERISTFFHTRKW